MDSHLEEIILEMPLPIQFRNFHSTIFSMKSSKNTTILLVMHEFGMWSFWQKNTLTTVLVHNTVFTTSCFTNAETAYRFSLLQGQSSVKIWNPM